MSFLDKIKKVLIPQSILMSEYGMTDADFFLKVLGVIPDGSLIYLEQDEPEEWVDMLKGWSFRKNAKQFDADYYIKDAAFVEEIKTLLLKDPKSINSIPLLYIIAPAGETLLSSNDNFTIMNISNSLRVLLK